MKGHVRIEKKKDTISACNCCSVSEQTLELWEIRFALGMSSTTITVCKDHLIQLQDEINRQLN